MAMNLTGTRLKEECIRAGMTVKGLAQLGGVRPNAQALYEKGTRLPRADYLAALLEGGIDVQYVISGERSHLRAANLTAEEAEVIENYRYMRRKDQLTLAQLASTLSTMGRSSAPSASSSIMGE
jgi:transcriptional regulator with XRE-family HTH domain